jgi:hypothetical protein
MAVQVQVPRLDMERLLLRMARTSELAIRRRAFPTGGKAGKGLRGETFRPLSKGYAKHKRKKGRPAVPDQRFTSGTANALGVTRSTRTEAAIGFRERRQIADALNRRNSFWGLSNAERLRALAIAERAGADLAKRIRIRGTVIVS